MATSNDEADYEVGYGKPPAATQFKPGRSGNPRGRPPKSKSLQNLVVKVLGEKHRLKDQPRGARVCYTALEVVMLTLKAMARPRPGNQALHDMAREARTQPAGTASQLHRCA